MSRLRRLFRRVEQLHVAKNLVLRQKRIHVLQGAGLHRSVVTSPRHDSGTTTLRRVDVDLAEYRILTGKSGTNRGRERLRVSDDLISEVVSLSNRLKVRIRNTRG